MTRTPGETIDLAAGPSARQLAAWRRLARACVRRLGQSRHAVDEIGDHAIYLLERRWAEARARKRRCGRRVHLPAHIEGWLRQVVFSLVVKYQRRPQRVQAVASETLDREPCASDPAYVDLDWSRFERALRPFLTPTQRDALAALSREPHLVRGLDAALGGVHTVFFWIILRARKLVQESKLTL